LGILFLPVILIYLDENQKKKKNKMGHLINPISFRIKKHGFWQVSWNNFLTKDYTYFFFVNNLIEQILISFSVLNCLKKKFLSFSLKYFLKNNTLILFLGFKLIKKSLFKNKIYNKRNFKTKLNFKLRYFLLKFNNKFKYFKNLHRYFKNFFFKKFLNFHFLFNILIKKELIYNLNILKNTYLFKIKQINCFFFKRYNLLNKYLFNKLYLLKKKQLICLILNKYVFFKIFKLYINSFLLKLSKNACIPFIKTSLNAYAFKEVLIKGMHAFLDNFNKDKNLKIYLKFIRKFLFYKKLAIRLYKKFIRLYNRRFKYKSSPYQFFRYKSKRYKIDRFKNLKSCKLWKRKTHNI
jgi:hypothetical protein